MSGSRNQGRTITEKLLDEIRSTFALVKKDFRQFPVDFVIDSELTIFSADFYCDTHTMDYRLSPFGIGQNFEPVEGIEVSVASCALLEKASVADNEQVALDWQPPVFQVPVFDQPDLFLHGVSFNNIEAVEGSGVRLESFETNPRALPVPKHPETQAREIELSQLKTSQKTRHFDALKGRAQPFSKAMYGLPFIRKALPSHRFSAESRQVFRQALAEKVKTTPSNVLINRIYDRVNRSQFQSISQDERGQLVCVPKLNYVGQKRKTEFSQTTAFLIMGQKLDTKENISVLVPVADLSADSSDVPSSRRPEDE